MAEQALQSLRRQVALEHAAHRHGDGAGLLRDNSHHGVRVLTCSDACPVAHAQLPRQIYIARHGKHTARAHNPSSADNHRAVVERGLVPEDIFQQFGIHLQSSAVPVLMASSSMFFRSNTISAPVLLLERDV